MTMLDTGKWMKINSRQPEEPSPWFRKNTYIGQVHNPLPHRNIYEGGDFLNWGWLNFIKDVFTNELVMEPLIAVILGYGVNMYSKNRKYKIIMDITADVVDYIEEHYKEWGIKGSEKMDKFLEIFAREFKKQLGREPKADDIETAKLRAEALVCRARRDSKK